MSRIAHRVETERLIMRNWSVDDAEAYRALLDRGDLALRPWIPWMRDEPMSLEATRERLLRHSRDFELGVNFRYPVFLHDGSLIGETGLYTRAGDGARETGYLIDSAHAGKSYASEAAMAMVRIAFEVDGVDRIELHCVPENAASNRVALKLGCQLEATLRRRTRGSDGVLRDSCVWSLFASGYAASPSAALPVSAFAADGTQLL